MLNILSTECRRRKKCKNRRKEIGNKIRGKTPGQSLQSEGNNKNKVEFLIKGQRVNTRYFDELNLCNNLSLDLSLFFCRCTNCLKKNIHFKSSQKLFKINHLNILPTTEPLIDVHTLIKAIEPVQSIVIELTNFLGYNDSQNIRVIMNVRLRFFNPQMVFSVKIFNNDSDITDSCVRFN